MSGAEKYFIELADTEIVFGIVAPLGTPCDLVEAALRARLEHHGYRASTIRLSHYLADGLRLDLRPDQRQEALMEKGKELRRGCREDYLALLAMSSIQERRRRGAHGQPIPRAAHIVRSLKHPEEALRLRNVYGRGFFLLGVSAPHHVRLAELIKRNFPKDEALRLLQKDAAESDEHGQQTRDVFELADAFLQVNDPRDFSVIEAQVKRIVDLLMTYPFHAPTEEEHAMFMAYSSAFRSADLSRQVGAVVVSPAGLVIGTGVNEVPAPGGGTWSASAPRFWSEGANAGADYERGYDSNERERNKIVAKVIRALVSPGALADDSDEGLVLRYGSQLRATGVMDLTEFGRAVHAEMFAILNCAKSGSSTMGATLYTTTFPCHNCTKHIVAAGIRQVVYVEPYPKSKAKALHDDAIVLTDEEDEPVHAGDRRVWFRAFNGIGPRRFVDLFSLTLGSGRPVRRKLADKSGTRLDWKPGAHSAPRLPLDPRSYLDRETAAVKDFREHMPSSTSRA